MVKMMKKKRMQFKNALFTPFAATMILAAWSSSPCSSGRGRAMLAEVRIRLEWLAEVRKLLRKN